MPRFRALTRVSAPILISIPQLYSVHVMVHLLQRLLVTFADQYVLLLLLILARDSIAQLFVANYTGEL